MASWQATLIGLMARVTMKHDFRSASSVEDLKHRIERYARLSRVRRPDYQLRDAGQAEFQAEWIDAGIADAERVLLYIPGGALFMPAGDPHRALVARLCRRLQLRGLLVHYRLAPEHRFPAALRDCVAAYRHLLKSGFAPQQIVLAGESAGGCLVLSTLLSLRDQGMPLPAAAVLMSPLTDLTMQSHSRRSNRWRDPIIPVSRRDPIREIYLDADTPAEHPLVSPVFANYCGLPPILAQVGNTEILRDDTIRAARKARASGTYFEVEVWDEMPHAWHLMPFVPESGHAIERIAAFLQQRL